MFSPGKTKQRIRWGEGKKVRTVIQDSCLRWKEIKVHRVSTLQDENNHGDGWWWWLNIIHAFNTTELYTYKWLMSVAQFSSVQSLGCVQLFCDPMDCSPPASSVQGILQVRILEWLAVCYSRRSSQPWNPTQVSCMADRFFTSEPPGTLQVVKMVNFMSSVSCHNQKHYLKSSHISPFDQAPI